MQHRAGSTEPGDAPKKRRAGRVAHRRATAKALQQADELLHGVLQRAGEEPPPADPTPSEQARQLVARGAKALPVPRQLPVKPDMAKLHDRRERVERALQNRAQLLRHLRPVEPQPQLKALPAPDNSLTMRASHLATRYGAHALVLVVVLVVLLSNAFPPFKAQADEGITDMIGDELEYSEIDSWLEVRDEYDPANPVSNYISNPALLYTAVSERIEVYTVGEGDTLQSLAERFQLRPETIMAANSIFDPTIPLVAGSNLIILPVDGTYHVVTETDTLQGVAQLYQVEPQVIAEFKANGLEPPYTLKLGQALVVPGGVPLARDGIIVHRVVAGETVDSVAGMFGLDPQSVYDANPELVEGAPLSAGQALRILPVPGVAYTVKPGDTLLSIAQHFDTDPQMIVDYGPNNLRSDADLRLGEMIIVPGGYIVPPTPTPTPTDTPTPTATPTDTPTATPTEIPTNTPVPAPPAQKPAVPAATKAPAPAPTKAPAKASWVGTGSFIWPVGGVITTYFSKNHNGIDIANKAGTPLRAADSGEVIYAGWRTDGLGYAVLIDHHNGYVTVYGHMIRQPAVYVGEIVAKGEVIGYMGSTGKSTGPHVHFIIRSPDRVYMNPLRFLN